MFGALRDLRYAGGRSLLMGAVMGDGRLCAAEDAAAGEADASQHRAHHA